MGMSKEEYYDEYMKILRECNLIRIDPKTSLPIAHTTPAADRLITDLKDKFISENYDKFYWFSGAKPYFGYRDPSEKIIKKSNPGDMPWED